jgi:hypothetical protein
MSRIRMRNRIWRWRWSRNRLRRSRFRGSRAGEEGADEGLGTGVVALLVHE